MKASKKGPPPQKAKKVDKNQKKHEGIANENWSAAVKFLQFFDDHPSPTLNLPIVTTINTAP